MEKPWIAMDRCMIFFWVPVMGEKCKDIIIQSNIGERKQLVGGIPTPLKNDGVRQWVWDDYSHI